MKRVDTSMDYSFASAAWSDCHSTISLVWPNGNEPGLQWLNTMRTFGGAVVTQSLLNWELYEDGSVLPLTFEQRECRPEVVREYASTVGIRLESEVYWIEHNTIQLASRLINTGDIERTIEFRYLYPTKGKKNSTARLHAGRYIDFGNRRMVGDVELNPLDGAPDGSWLGEINTEELKEGEEHYVGAFLIESSVYAVYCFTELCDKQITLAPGKSVELKAILAIGFQWDETRMRFLKHQAQHKTYTSALATARFQKMLADAPEIDADFSGNASYEGLYIQALYGLNSLYLKDESAIIGDLRIPWTTKYGLAGGFFWDTSFSSVGGVLVNPKAAMESIEAFSKHSSHRGAMPFNLSAFRAIGEGQFPIMSWAAWNIYSSTKDSAWLERILPGLRRHIDFWFRYYCRDYGACFIYSSALGNDNDVRYDYCMKGLYNQSVHGIDSPDINAFLVVELRALANMYEVLNRHEEATPLRERATKLNHLIVERMYFPEDNVFLDVDEGTHERKSGTITPFMFLPLWSEAPLKKESIDAMIKRYMLGADTFNRKYPFPSVAFNNPEYDPEGYWRGRIWPHTVFWMIQILWMHGFEKESNEVATNLLNMMLETPCIRENYNSETGVGWSTETLRGWPGYNWSYSTAILLLTGKHKLPPLPKVK